jgi:integrase
MIAHITMQMHATNFLGERRQLGFDLRAIGYSVSSFARYVDALKLQGPPTIEVMADWARCDKGNSGNPETWARRLGKLRPFTRYLQQFEPLTEVPDDFTFGRIGQRPTPHIYIGQEIIDLLAAAHRLGPQPGLRGATYETLFGLIASAGLRVSEAVHLLDTDVDLKAGMLTIRLTKFTKSRYVPLHPSAVEMLKRYRSLRNLHINFADEMPFFVGTRGRCRGRFLGLRQVHKVFDGLRDQLGWVNRGTNAAPRIHDLRHTFIVNRVMLWHTQGVNVDQQMLALSTYVGHAKITNTYWYLSGVPQLMAVAANKFEAFTQMQEVSHV